MRKVIRDEMKNEKTANAIETILNEVLREDDQSASMDSKGVLTLPPVSEHEFDKFLAQMKAHFA